MAVKITPEPSPDEHEALLRALAALDEKGDSASAWWRTGIREAVEEEPDES